MSEFEYEGMTVYTTPVAQLKAKNGTKDWDENLVSIAAVVGLMLPLIVTTQLV